MQIEYLSRYKYPFWRVKYKNKVYCREEKHMSIFWTIENVGQNRELYDIQHKLEDLFHKTIRKNKLNKINKNVQIQ